MELWELGEENAEKGAGVDEKMRRIVFCVETCENIPVRKENNRIELDAHLDKKGHKTVGLKILAIKMRIKNFFFCIIVPK